MTYANTDHAAMSWDGAVQYVIDGKCAMTIMGDWAEGYFKAKGSHRTGVRLGAVTGHTRAAS